MKHFSLTMFAAAILCFGLTGNAAVNIECDRECLADFMTTYLKALVAHDASKLPETSAAQYRSFGLKIEPDRIITSGMLLKDYFETNNLIGARCIVLGPEDSVRYV